MAGSGGDFRSLGNQLFDQLDLDRNGVITHEDIDRLEAEQAVPPNVVGALRGRLGPREAPAPQRPYASMPAVAYVPEGFSTPIMGGPSPVGGPPTQEATPVGTPIAAPVSPQVVQPGYGNSLVLSPRESFRSLDYQEMASTVQSGNATPVMVPPEGPRLANFGAPQQPPYASMPNMTAYPPASPVVSLSYRDQPGQSPPQPRPVSMPIVHTIPQVNTMPSTITMPMPRNLTAPMVVQTAFPPRTIPAPQPQQGVVRITSGPPSVLSPRSWRSLSPRDSGPLPVQPPAAPPASIYHAAAVVTDQRAAEAQRDAPLTASSLGPSMSQEVLTQPTSAASLGQAHHAAYRNHPEAQQPIAPAVDISEGASPEEIFDLMDQNAHGFITREEFRAALMRYREVRVAVEAPAPSTLPFEQPQETDVEQVEAHVHHHDPTHEQLFTYRDIDGELTGAGHDLFTMIDRNGGGRITRNEWIAAFAGNKRIGLRDEAELHWDGLADEEESEDDSSSSDEGTSAPPDLSRMADEEFDVDAGYDFDVNANLDLDGLDPRHLHGHLNGHLHGGMDVHGAQYGIDPEAGLCEKMMHGCEHMIDYCETCCCVTILHQMAMLCGLNMDKDESVGARFFPWLFTLVCVILFATPIWQTYQLSQDMQVRYWISDQLSWVLIIIPFILLVQLWQAAKGRVLRPLVCFTLVGSCIFLLAIGDLVLLSSYTTSNALMANDCTSNLEKQRLQIQWQNAELFYTECMTQTAEATGSTLEVAYGLYRIQDCAGYSEKLNQNPAWPYLGALEQSFNCGGWCSRSQPLWTFKSVKDSCSTTVADVLYNKVQWSMLQVLMYTAFVFAFISIALIQTGPIVRSHGIKW